MIEDDLNVNLLCVCVAEVLTKRCYCLSLLRFPRFGVNMDVGRHGVALPLRCPVRFLHLYSALSLRVTPNSASNLSEPNWCAGENLRYLLILLKDMLNLCAGSKYIYIF